MSYLDDLDKNIEKAEKYLAKAEYTYKQGWSTAYDVTINAAEATIKVIRHCVECAKRRQAKLGADKKFECSGGCVKGVGFEKFDKSNKNLWFILSWTRRNDPRCKKEV